MREIFLILSMMALGLFSAKAFGAYIPTEHDKATLQSIESKIDTIAQSNPEKLTTIQSKIPSILQMTQNNPQARYVLTNISSYISFSLSSNTWSPELIISLSTQFE